MFTAESIKGLDKLPSPSLIFFSDRIDQNISELIRIAGGPERLRPHCKTHKSKPVIQKLLDHGIDKHKCATIAEAEMLASMGLEDVFLAYNLVGPNIKRIAELGAKFPQTSFAVTADHPGPLADLSREMVAFNQSVEVLIDLDTGLERTGIKPGDDALSLYEMISSLPGIKPGGLHWYDGQHRQTDLDERRAAVEGGVQVLLGFRDKILMNGFDVPRIVVGGTGSFPIHAAYQEPNLELSPGTVILHDAGYRSIYPDLNFQPAAMVFTRVISRPSPNRVTLDVGSKAIAADPPVEMRCYFPDFENAKTVLQNEEHLVLEFEQDCDWQPGSPVLAIPWHVCPTSALYDHAHVVRGDSVEETWEITARRRSLSV